MHEFEDVTFTDKLVGGAIIGVPVWLIMLLCGAKPTVSAIASYIVGVVILNLLAMTAAAAAQYATTHTRGR